MVLAIDALEIAICEKNVADAFGTGNGRFFPPVNTNR
jgi:hypothetical protein